MKSYGGDLIDRRKAFGEFRVVNAQSKADIRLLSEAIVDVASYLQVDPKIVEDKYEPYADSIKGRATLFVIDNDKEPMSLIAPEARWAMVNVGKLTCDKKQFFHARVKKEVCRATAQLFGAFSNKYESNVLGGVFSAEDLDQIIEPRIPMEYRSRFEKYIPQMGFETYKVVPYSKAVQQGWAPAPTNDVQKAIWDKTHALPKNPMKIEFDPKKGR